MDAAASPGTQIGPYRVVRTLGTGGWSTVYEVTAPDGATLALKRLRDDLPPAAIARFRREVDSLRRVDHPGVLALIDAGVDGAAPYLVTRRVAGHSLRDLIAAGPLGSEAAVVIAAAAADALGAIHATGLVHRDIKPDNIMITPAGEVIVIDLGLALGSEHSRHTAEDTVAGSVPYMAPEQIEDRTPSPATDVWALAVVLYEAATGRRPFQRDRHSEEVAAILGGVFAPLAQVEPRCPDAVSRLIGRCLTAAPTSRPATGTALAAELVAAIDWVEPASIAGERARLAAAPADYAASVAPQRTARCAAAARTALAAGDAFAAGRAVDLGLAIAPDDPTLRGLLDQVLGGRAAGVVGTPAATTGRGPTRARIVLVGMMAIAFAIGVAHAVHHHVTSPPLPAEVAPPAPGPPGAPPAPGDRSSRPGELSRPAHVLPSQGATTPPPRPAPAPPGSTEVHRPSSVQPSRPAPP